MSQTHIDSDKIIKQRNFEIFVLTTRIFFAFQTALSFIFFFFNFGTGVATGNENIFAATWSVTTIIEALIWIIGFGLWWASLVISIIANNISAQTKSPARGLAIASMVLAIVSFIPILSTVIHIAGIVVSGILISKLNKFATKGNHVVEVEAKESNDA
jgi:hypothetical protein